MDAIQPRREDLSRVAVGGKAVADDRLGEAGRLMEEEHKRSCEETVVAAASRLMGGRGTCQAERHWQLSRLLS
jgi:hypothetical protein